MAAQPDPPAQAAAAILAGDPIAARAAAEEGRDLADAIGDRYDSHQCRYCLGWAQVYQGDLAGAAVQFAELAAEAEAAHDGIREAQSLALRAVVLAYQGEMAAPEGRGRGGHRGCRRGWRALRSHGLRGVGCRGLGRRGCCDGAGRDRGLAALGARPRTAGVQRSVQCVGRAGGRGSDRARRWADEAVTMVTGSYSSRALTMRARVAIAQGEPEQAERDAHDALARAAEVEAYLYIPDILECLAVLAGDAGSHREAARLFGAAEAIRQRMGAVRFKVWDASYEASVAALRDAMGEKDFDSAWAEGAALSTEEAIAYAQRGRGQRKRPTSGWASLTPTELDVVRLVSEGLGNNDIATRLFVSPRTVQTHLTHVYTKLGLTSRVQLVQEAARHT